MRTEDKYHVLANWRHLIDSLAASNETCRNRTLTDMARDTQSTRA